MEVVYWHRVPCENPDCRASVPSPFEAKGRGWGAKLAGNVMTSPKNRGMVVMDIRLCSLVLRKAPMYPN